MPPDDRQEKPVVIQLNIDGRKLMEWLVGDQPSQRMRFGLGRYRARDPGSLGWWVGYLACKALAVCWTGHPLKRANADCREFWHCERMLIDAHTD